MLSRLLTDAGTDALVLTDRYGISCCTSVRERSAAMPSHHVFYCAYAYMCATHTHTRMLPSS